MKNRADYSSLDAQATPSRWRLSLAWSGGAFVGFWLSVLIGLSVGDLYLRLLGIATVRLELFIRPFVATSALIALAAAVLLLRRRGSAGALPITVVGGLVLALLGWLGSGGWGAAFWWPGPLFLTQLLLGAATAGAIAGLGLSVDRNQRRRQAVITGMTLVVAGLISLLLACWPQWTAQKRFESAATTAAIDYFKLIGGFQVLAEPPVEPDSALDYRAVSSLGAPGERFAVTVQGSQRRSYDIAVEGIEGVLQLDDGGKLGLPGWPDLDSPAARIILQDLIQSISVPRMTLDVALSRSSQALFFRGGGMLAQVLRPTGSGSVQPQALIIIFTVNPVAAAS